MALQFHRTDTVNVCAQMYKQSSMLTPTLKKMKSQDQVKSR